ncbi:fasciclin-like arabinogalactan protein 1 [Magnolia sinica]|uniref:fasciclin-like arabinogalactan protein 1 n=1 Tax=Magnolia sinica TaxID=86752 RepID=UPI00265973D0|nr:fasciclin-like arabinogalactan protein 1 [Magnolia sinica]
MQLLPAAFLLLLLICAADAHNITKILAKHPEFSTFNHYLSLTHLAPEINRRETITVLAVDNAGMSELLSKHLTIYALKNVLSLHILLDYFGAKKLHQITNGTALSATMYQATGSAPGTAGFVNITDLKGGKVGFGAEDSGTLDASFVKSVQEIPYNISIIHISKILTSPEAEAPTPAPNEMNLTALMSKQGCKVFADLLTASGSLKTFEDNLDGGLTVFCPGDDATKKFMPKYKNLTAEGKASLLLFHGVPVYQSIAMLKSNNGVMNTLATDGVKKFDFTVQNNGEEVTLQTKIVTAKITGTVVDEEPLAVYTLDKVLEPKELFKKVETPAPAPAPEKPSPAPKGKKLSPPAPEGPDLAPSDDQKAADDDSGSVRFNGGWAMVVGLGVMLLI